MRDLTSSLEKLFALHTFGIKPGLDTERELLARLANPQDRFAVIHIAGTNGKGSVSAMLDAVLRTAGYRVGLYTSPHLVRFNERIRVGGHSITDEELAELFDLMEPQAQAVKAATGREATFFEFTTALAFEYFRRKNVQLAVVETGMGGRLDATNVVTPLLSVITRIGLEHTEYLGATIEAIAGEKAGIIKAGRPVVCGAMPAGARDVIRAAAGERGALLVDATETAVVRRVSQSLAGQKLALSTGTRDYGTVTMSFLGKHQIENCATALAALETILDAGVPVSEEAVRQGLAAARWPARLQVLSELPPVLLDGAHNPDGARVLAVALRELFGKRPVGLVWGMCGDKDALGFAKALGGRVKRCWAVPLRSERGVDPAKLALLACGEGWVAETRRLPEALDQARAWAAEEGGGVCIAGSLFLAGEVLEAMEG